MTKEGFGKLVSLKEALDIISHAVGVIPGEQVETSVACGRILGEDVTAAIDVPHFMKSAMDGFAVIAQDTFGASNTRPKRFAVIDSITAGMVSAKDVKHGKCIEITTGAPLPHGADAVLMVEYAEKSSGSIACYSSVAPGDNVIAIGSDIRKGTLLLRKGQRLNPRSLGAIASLGMQTLSVRCRPKVAYFSTGNEVLAAGESLAPGMVYDINSCTIMDTLRLHPCRVESLGIIRDDVETIKRTLLSAVERADLVLLSGGSSLGGEDFMVEAVRELGTVLVHGIAVKPGKPVLIGTIMNKLVLGLPGYPTSALSNIYTLVLPTLYRMLGAQYEPVRTDAVLSRKVASTIGRFEFLAVRLEEHDGTRSAVPVMKGSSAITTLAEADGYICIGENTEIVNKGEEVQVNLF